MWKMYINKTQIHKKYTFIVRKYLVISETKLPSSVKNTDCNLIVVHTLFIHYTVHYYRIVNFCRDGL